MKQLSEVLLVPVEYKVEVGIAGDEAGVEFAFLSEDFDFAELKFKVFHEYGVIGIVLKEQDIMMIETVGFA
jgi:hypothetical protein